MTENEHTYRLSMKEDLRHSYLRELVGESESVPCAKFESAGEFFGFLKGGGSDDESNFDCPVWKKNSCIPMPMTVDGIIAYQLLTVIFQTKDPVMMKSLHAMLATSMAGVIEKGFSGHRGFSMNLQKTVIRLRDSLIFAQATIVIILGEGLCLWTTMATMITDL